MLAMSDNIRENLYTVDLICHGSPSPKILKLALYEKGIDILQLKEIRFRNKTNFGLSSRDEGGEYKTIVPAGVQDMYTHAFLPYSLVVRMLVYRGTRKKLINFVPKLPNANIAVFFIKYFFLDVLIYSLFLRYIRFTIP